MQPSPSPPATQVQAPHPSSTAWEGGPRDELPEGEGQDSPLQSAPAASLAHVKCLPSRKSLCNGLDVPWDKHVNKTDEEMTGPAGASSFTCCPDALGVHGPGCLGRGGHSLQRRQGFGVRDSCPFLAPIGPIAPTAALEWVPVRRLCLGKLGCAAGEEALDWPPGNQAGWGGLSRVEAGGELDGLLPGPSLPPVSWMAWAGHFWLQTSRFLPAERRQALGAMTPSLSAPGHPGDGMPWCCRARQGVVHDKLLQKGFRLSVSGGSFPPRPPARFEMPAARGKTSLNARDW